MKDKTDSKLSESKRINGLALAKTGFIFPVSMTLNYLPSLTGESTLAVIVKKEKQISYTAHIITNKELDILYISSECLKLFALKEKAVWSIKNYFNLPNKEDRLNLKKFIKELCDEGRNLTDYDQEKNYSINVKECENSKQIRRKSTNCILTLNLSKRFSFRIYDQLEQCYDELQGVVDGSKKFRFFLN
jgi:hypothetical protein